jgi:hypothetical protein
MMRDQTGKERRKRRPASATIATHRDSLPILTVAEVEIWIRAGAFEAGFQRAELEALGGDQEEAGAAGRGGLAQRGLERPRVVGVGQLIGQPEPDRPGRHLGDRFDQAARYGSEAERELRVLGHHFR